MHRHWNARMAWANMKNNKSIYLPYLMAASLIVMLFYSLRSVALMVADSGAAGGATMNAMLQMSSWICGMLSLVILFYINSFIMKRRKKEFGLYSVLGMEKRHIAMVIAWEVLLTGTVGILCGIVLGALFSQLLFLLLLKIVGLPAALRFQIPFGEAAATVVLFGIGFLVLLGYDIISVCRTDPIALLRSEKEGEREPKTKWVTAIVGFVTLGAGYLLALTVKTPSDALTVFFPAVLLVMIGTYCLFVAGSILILKLLRRNKGFYYQPQNFISISGMMYRMKQNAVGLSNICILATCVLVTLSSTVSLFIGEEDILRARYPRQIRTSCVMEDAQSGEQLMQASRRHAEDYGVSIQNEIGYAAFRYPASYTDGVFTASDGSDALYELDAVSLSDYNRIMGTQLQLSGQEVLVALSEMQMDKDEISLQGVSYHIRQRIEMPAFLSRSSGYPGALMILPDSSHLEELSRRVNEAFAGKATYNVMYYYDYDLSGEPPQTYYTAMREKILQTVDRLAETSSIDTAREDFYQLYGSLLFVGIFFVSLFLIATVLIIYYKQITEGFDDRDRFCILRKVGMSDREVRNTINQQVLMVFFFPLGMAVIHISVAFPVLCKLLLAFQMTNRMLFFGCTACAVVLFALLYYAVYHVTSKTYYRIVQGK